LRQYAFLLIFAKIICYVRLNNQKQI